MKRLVSVTILLLFAGLLVAVSGCNGGIRNPANADFTIQVSGVSGTEFTGFCTHEVKYLIGSRTEETDIQGKLTADKTTLEFRVSGIEMSCKINLKTANKPITIVAFKDSAEFYRVENTTSDTYFDWYPPDTAK